jgi:prepilin-type N-terminal cleavage/methylation domain-containing protein
MIAVSRRRAPRAPRQRRGFTLLEVLISLVILATVLVTMAGFMTSFVRNSTIDGQRARAADLVSTRLEAIKGVTKYEALDGWAKTESAIPGYAGFTRVTTITRVQNTKEDYKIVTVRATSPMLGTEYVRKSTVVARY